MRIDARVWCRIASSIARRIEIEADCEGAVMSSVTMSISSGALSLKSIDEMKPWREIAMCVIDPETAIVSARRWSGVRIGICCWFCELKLRRAERA